MINREPPKTLPSGEDGLVRVEKFEEILKEAGVFTLKSTVLIASLALAGAGILGFVVGFEYGTGWADKELAQQLLGSALIALPAGISLYAAFREIQVKRVLEVFSLKQKERENDLIKEQVEDRRNWLVTQQEALTEMAGGLSQEISKRLQRNTFWASEALRAANITSRSDSIFSERLEHFKEEKEFIAKHFCAELVERCFAHIASGSKVVLLVDSGTTLHPFFKELAADIGRRVENRSGRFTQIEIVTNNLPGVNALMEFGRVSPSRFSDLVLPCRLIPGTPRPAYNATVGTHAESFLRDVRTYAAKDNDLKDLKVIGLVTSNWIVLRKDDHGEHYPALLARGEGHGSIKQEIVRLSDETFVISPLGKIVQLSSTDELNNCFGLTNRSDADPAKHPYDEVAVSANDRKKLRLITTKRASNERILARMSTFVEAKLQVAHEASKDFTDVSRIPDHRMYPFENLPDDGNRELAVELPHGYTRYNFIRKKLFGIDEIPIRGGSHHFGYVRP